MFAVKIPNVSGVGMSMLRSGRRHMASYWADMWKNLVELPRPVAICTGLCLTFGVGVLDWLMPQELSLSVLYLIPVITVTILGGRTAGLLIALLSAVLWLGTDLARAGGLEHAFALTWNSVVELIIFVAVVLILSRLMVELKRQKENACSDVLTGIANRRGFLEQADKELNRSRRQSRPLALMYVDLDGFKVVNDQYGHPSGDALLYEVASEIRGNTRSFDVVARIGGDEFAVLLPETDALAAKVCALNILNALTERMQLSDWPVTFSIGLATFYEHFHTVDIMLEHADKLMYEAKRRGKNRMVTKEIGTPAATDVIERRTEGLGI
jgi:diguanylate cyclase (GGDEF)-like protein